NAAPAASEGWNGVDRLGGAGAPADRDGRHTGGSSTSARQVARDGAQADEGRAGAPTRAHECPCPGPRDPPRSHMRPPAAPRAELERLRAEREEWKRRAEAPRHEPAPLPRSKPKRSRWPLSLLVASVLAFGFGLGAVTLPVGSGGAVRTDYAGCIGKARY